MKKPSEIIPNALDLSGKPVHFIGIGGIGMSALAYVLAKKNLPVSGSDLRPSHITQQLEGLGVKIFKQQEAQNLSRLVDPETNGHGSGSQVSPPQVVCSTAIRDNNSEYRAALEMGCPIFHRSDVLAALMQQYQAIAVAGTHGKTTTSSLIGYLLLKAGLDPTIIVGGEVAAWQGNARTGESCYLVAEADESDGSLVKFSPQIGVVTNIELDHPDHYSTLAQVVSIFQTFTDQCQQVVACLDCPTIRDHLFANTSPAQLTTYSLHPKNQATYTVDQISYGATGSTARVWERGEILGSLGLQLLGEHNLANALAAVAVGRLLGLDFARIAEAIATFSGAGRRFEVRGQAHNIRFVDDYAHHPSEIRATLAAARLQVQQGSDRKRLVAVFQPHRFSRTQTFLDEFSQGFKDADLVVLTDIYAAGEPDLGLIKGQHLADLTQTHHPQVFYQPTLPQVIEFLQHALCPGDLVLLLGAGNLNQTLPELLAYYQQVEAQAMSEVAAL